MVDRLLSVTRVLARARALFHPMTQAIHDLDQILDQITETKAQIELLQARMAGLQDQLTDAVERGDLDPAFSHNDWSFRLSQGRITTTYSDSCKQAIKDLQQHDLSSGNAQQKQGSSFWTIKAPTL